MHDLQAPTDCREEPLHIIRLIIVGIARRPALLGPWKGNGNEYKKDFSEECTAERLYGNDREGDARSEAFERTDEFVGKEITVGGWIRNIRDSKSFGFG